MKGIYTDQNCRMCYAPHYVCVSDMTCRSY